MRQSSACAQSEPCFADSAVHSWRLRELGSPLTHLRGAGLRCGPRERAAQPRCAAAAFQPEHDNASRLRDDITKIYEAVGPDPIFGWFFGHEHKCTIYDDSYSSYRARLIGDGCIPHLPPGLPGNPPIPFTATNTTTRPNGSGYAISGFALLTLNGPILQVEYINEDGTVWTQETWTRTLAAAA